MRRDLWDDPYLRDEPEHKPSLGTTALLVLLIVLGWVLLFVALSSVSWATLD